MGALIKIWAQVEKMLNKALMGFINLILKLRPNWLLRLIQFSKNCAKSFKYFIAHSVCESRRKSQEKLNQAISNFKTSLKEYNAKVDRLLKEIKHIKPKDILNKARLSSSKIFLSPFNFVNRAPLYKKLGYVTAISFIMWGVYNLHYSQDLYNQKSKVNRKIASVNKKDPSVKYKKPGYHLKRLRTLPLTNVQLPILIKGTDFYKSTNVDFSIVSSNKHITHFLDEKEELLRDHLMMNIKEVHPEFTLTAEGKKIIEDKILKETNIFIKKYKVTGEIEEVLISNILANP